MKARYFEKEGYEIVVDTRGTLLWEDSAKKGAHC